MKPNITFKILILSCFCWLVIACQPHKTSYGLYGNSDNALDLRNENIISGSQEEISRLYRERVKNKSDGQIILKKTAYPKYPDNMLTAGLEGVTLIDFVVTQKGRVTQLVVVKSAGKEFDQAAISCLKRWRFNPILKNGQPVAAHLRHSFHFILDNP